MGVRAGVDITDALVAGVADEVVTGVLSVAVVGVPMAGLGGNLRGL